MKSEREDSTMMRLVHLQTLEKEREEEDPEVKEVGGSITSVSSVGLWDKAPT